MPRALATLVIGAIAVAAGYVTRTEVARQAGAAGTNSTAKPVVTPRCQALRIHIEGARP